MKIKDLWNKIALVLLFLSQRQLVFKMFFRLLVKYDNVMNPLMRKILPSFLAGFLILLTVSTGLSFANQEENSGANLSRDYEPESGISGQCLFNDKGWVQCQFFDDDGISRIAIKEGDSYSFGCLRAADLPKLEFDERETIEMLVADCDGNDAHAEAKKPHPTTQLLGTLKIAG